MTTSKNVADVFSKEHKIVLRDLRDMKCSDEFRGYNFVPSSYESLQGKVLPCINMTKDGFTLLVMKYAGEKAMKFKEAYISRFNELANQTNHVQSLLLEAQRLMSDYKVKGQDWSDFGRELKKRKPLIACALKDAEELTQLELGI